MGGVDHWSLLTSHPRRWSPLETTVTTAKMTPEDGDIMDATAEQSFLTAMKGMVDVPLDSSAKGSTKDTPVQKQVPQSPAKAGTMEPAKEWSNVKLKTIRRELETNMEHAPDKKNE